MINEENLNKLYERVLDGLEIKTNELNQIGFNSKDIKRLIDQETIQRIKRGLYTFIDSKGLYEYSNKIRTSKDYHKSIRYLEKCYQIDPTNERVSYLIFFYLIMEGEYNQAITYYDNFANNSSVSSKANSNFYLYLLSMITILPEKYRKYAQNLKLEDLFETSIKPKYKSDRSLNKIKELAFKQKFSYAYSCLNQSQEIFDNNFTMAIITKKLLREAALIRRLDCECILRKINQEDYEGIINYYKVIKKYHNLNEIDNCVLYLAQNIVRINCLKHIPPISIFDTGNWLKAIEGNNFELALNIWQKKIEEMHNDSKNSNPVFLLLDKIVKMCKEIALSLVFTNQISNNMTEAQDETLSILDNQSSMPTLTVFTEVSKYLSYNMIDTAFKIIQSYMDELNKGIYATLIFNLIKISLLEKDSVYTKPMLVLNEMSKDDWNFNVSEYIENFYEALSQNQFDIARLYVDIISSNIPSDELKVVINTFEKNYHFKQMVLALKDLQNINDSNPNLDLTKDYGNDIKYIESKLSELYNNGIVLLEPMDTSRAMNIYRIVKNIPNMVSFSIEIEDVKQAVLRYKINGDINIKYYSLVNEGCKAYRAQNYDLCIKKLREALLYGTPPIITYSLLGLSYMIKNDITPAIAYLSVATSIAKVQGKKDFDFTKKILELKEEAQNQPSDMIEDKVNNDANNILKLSNYNEIYAYLNQSPTKQNDLTLALVPPKK